MSISFRKRKKRVSASAAWEGALVQFSAPVSCVLTACLAAYRARVSTWAGRGGKRDGSQLTRTELEAVGDKDLRVENADTAGSLPRNLLRFETGCDTYRRPLEEKTSYLWALGNHRFLLK